MALSAIVSINVAGGRNIFDGFPRVVGGGEAVPSDEVEGLIVAGGFGGEDFVDAVKAAHGASAKWKVESGARRKKAAQLQYLWVQMGFSKP